MAPTVSVGKVKSVPEQWSRILNSKKYGVCAYGAFKVAYDEMKRARPGVNYFTAVSDIRTKFEGTAEWHGLAI